MWYLDLDLKRMAKCIFNPTVARMVAGPPRIGVGPGFDSQGSVNFFTKYCFPNLHWIHGKAIEVEDCEFVPVIHQPWNICYICNICLICNICDIINVCNICNGYNMQYKQYSKDIARQLFAWYIQYQSELKLKYIPPTQDPKGPKKPNKLHIPPQLLPW